MAANCPECESTIDLDEMDVDIGDELSCSECGALIRVASDRPLEFELADDEDDDDEDKEDDDEVEEEEVEDEESGWGDESEE
jgi:alpha-aminoadipate/glutamate carrier protein LysW